jgi:hypothetical protein
VMSWLGWNMRDLRAGGGLSEVVKDAPGCREVSSRSSRHGG